MTENQFKSEAVRRHDDSSIDFDFYRTRAVALRRQAMRDSRALRTAANGVLVMAGAMGFALVIPSASTLGDRISAFFSITSRIL